MSGFTARSLCGVLEAHTPVAATGWLVAVSGGADSACLLAAMAQLPVRRLPLRAIHVDHGLQPAAPDFRRACESQCRELQISLEIVSVHVEPGGSIEARARHARYAGIAAKLRRGECLLTAHHAQDQAETLLLQLLRGAGVKGLSAMPLCRPYAAGWHLRPLLDVAHRDLLEFGVSAGVAAVADPMNVDPRFDRAYLRTAIWPQIEQRWPGAAGALSRTARHAADAQVVLEQSAALIVQKLRDGEALSVSGLRALPAASQLFAVRHWIMAGRVETPSTARLTEALRQMVHAEESHQPAVVWGDHSLRRYRDRLYMTSATLPKVGEPRAWHVSGGECFEVGEGLGRLRWSPRPGGLDAARLPQTLHVKRRVGGEKLKPHRDARTQSIQHLCQSLGVLPWMRDALPFVYADDVLIAIGDVWLDARWCVSRQAPGFVCVWEDAPVIV